MHSQCLSPPRKYHTMLGYIIMLHKTVFIGQVMVTLQKMLFIFGERSVQRT